MTDEEYKELCQIIEQKMFELDHLQAVHKRETGSEFVRGVALSTYWERETTTRPIWARAGGE